MPQSSKQEPIIRWDHFPRVAPGLHIVATPIGHLGDVTLRALQVLAHADLIYCEDTRVTGRLLARYEIKSSLRPYHDHNAAEARPAILAALREGATIALVSDAGTPLISDPGYKLVRAVLEAGLPLTAAPGPSALLTALVLGGLPTDQFHFLGFAPNKSAARKAFLREAGAWPGTIVIYETANRLAGFLADACDVLGNRTAALARELTKLHEEVRRATLQELLTEIEQGRSPRGECVLLIGEKKAEDEAGPSETEIDRRLAKALAKMSLKEAAAAIAADLGLPRKLIYARALALKGQTENADDADE